MERIWEGVREKESDLNILYETDLFSIKCTFL